MKKIFFVFTVLSAIVLAVSCKPDNRPGEVHGIVSYNERNVPGAIITYTGDNGTYTYTANSSGYYIIRDIPAGDYIVSVSYNGKDVASYLANYEKSENPSLVSIAPNGYHVRNIIIPLSEDMGWDVPSGGEEDDHTLPEAEIPILAWHSIPANFASEETYQELKDCGFTLSLSHTSTLEEANAALDFAEQVGIKVIVPCNETNTEDFVNAVKDKPALYGYFLRDEPKTTELDALGTLADRILAVDSEHAIYLNLFPNYASDEVLGSTYEEYVKQSVEKVKTTLVSFDFYPIRETGVVNSWWYNLEIIKQYSQKAGLPFWAFALSTSHDPYPIPELSHLRLQMYTNLAYGAQALQYFTYWCPTPTDQWDFHDAPIAEDGERTDVYDLVKEMNEELQARAGVFMGCEVKGVYHTGETPPVGTNPLTGSNPPINKLSINEGDALISFFDNGDWSYVMMVNRSYEFGFNYSIIFDKDMQRVNRDGSIEDIGGSTEDHIEAGDCVIFRWKED